MFRGLYVCLSVFLLVTTASTAKTDERIELPLGVWIRVGPRNPRSKDQFFEGASPKHTVKYREYPARCGLLLSILQQLFFNTRALLSRMSHAVL